MHSRFNYLKELFKLALPIIMGNLGFIMIGVGDVVVAGRHSTDTLSAISLSNAIISCLMMLGIGMLTSVSAILSNYKGSGDKIEKFFVPSFKFAMLLSLITFSLILLFIPFIDNLGFETKFVHIMKEYFVITSFTVFGAYIHCMVKEYLQAFEIVIFPNLLTIFCIFVNVILNIVFVFGIGNVIPSMGATGLALSTLFTRYFMGLTLLVYCFYKIPELKNQIKMSFKLKYFKYYKDLFKVGLPSSIAVMVEFVGFNIIAVVMGRVLGIYAAAHTILCTLTSVTFMVPLAISNAVAVKVGYSNGAKDYYNLKQYAFSAIKMSVGFMACAGIVIGFFPDFLISLFTGDIELIKICVPILYVLCFFQICDGLQVSLSGIFKGLKQTKVVMIMNFIGYWIIAFQLGYVLAFKFNMELFGFWVSLLIASGTICISMYFIMTKKLQKLN